MVAVAVTAEVVLVEDAAVAAASAEVAVAVPEVAAPEVVAPVAPAAVSREVRARTRARVPLWAGAGVPDTMAVAAAWAAS